LGKKEKLEVKKGVALCRAKDDGEEAVQQVRPVRGPRCGALNSNTSHLRVAMLRSASENAQKEATEGGGTGQLREDLRRPYSARVKKVGCPANPSRRLPRLTNTSEGGKKERLDALTRAKRMGLSNREPNKKKGRETVRYEGSFRGERRRCELPGGDARARYFTATGTPAS